MRIIKIFQKIILPQKAQKWVANVGVKNILETKQNVFHGINPTAIYLPSNKQFFLPRFCSAEMKQARAMNKIAIHKAKTGVVENTYSKATPEDFKRLTDTSFDACNQRCTYVDPKTNIEYNLLGGGKTNDGLNIIKVLDKNGEYIKTVEVKPKKIIIIDDFTNIETYYDMYDRIAPISVSHGDLVTIFAKRNNPFAEYEQHDIAFNNSNKSPFFSVINDLQNRTNNGEKIDYVSCSFNLFINENFKNFVSKLNIDNLCSDAIKYAKIYIKIIKQQLSSLTDNKHTRVIVAAGNNGTILSESEFFGDRIEGVGSLAINGKISKFLGSRNSIFTQHYEIGEFTSSATKHGISLTGGKSTEIPFSENDKIMKYHGEKPNLASTKENNIYLNLCDKLIRARGNKAFYEEKLNRHIEKLKLDNKVVTKDNIEYFEPYNPLDAIRPEDEPAIFIIDKTGKLMFSEFYTPAENRYDVLYKHLRGTSFSTPIRTAKLALNDMMQELL